MEKIITPLIGPISEPFKIPVGGQITLLAQGLQGADRVLVEVVSTTSAGPGNDPCCPGPVALPEVATAEPLRCRNGARAILTAAHPWLVLDAPQDVELRARLEASDELAIVNVSLGATDSADCKACECREPYAAAAVVGSGAGYGFYEGPDRDPDATVQVGAPPAAVYVYPTPRPGASTPVVVSGAIVGYAVNIT